MKTNSDVNNDDMSTPLKVLFVTHNYIRSEGDFPGVFLHLLARKLRESGIDTHVVAPHDADIPEYEEIHSIRIYRFRYGDDDTETLAYRGDMHGQLLRNPFKIFRLIKFLKSAYRLASSIVDKEDISVVSIHWLLPNGVVGWFLKRRYKERIRLLLSSHGTDVRLLTGFPLVYSFFKWIIRKADGWTVVSRYLKNLIEKRDSRAAAKIKIIPLPNDETIFYPDDSIPEDRNLIIAASRLTVQKRLGYLLEAIRIVSEQIPDIKLEIYGTGPEKIKLERQIDLLGLTESVKIHDPIAQEELRKAYNRAAIVVLNSIDEGFGLVLIEAMLCCTAVIGTNSGGITDIIDNEKSGILVPPDDAEKLAGEIKKLLEDHSLRKRLADAGYQKALRQFSSESAAKQYADLFKGK